MFELSFLFKLNKSSESFTPFWRDMCYTISQGEINTYFNFLIRILYIT